MWGNMLNKVVCGVYVEFMIKDGEKERYLEKLDIWIMRGVKGNLMWRCMIWEFKINKRKFKGYKKKKFK